MIFRVESSQGFDFANFGLDVQSFDLTFRTHRFGAFHITDKQVGDGPVYICG